MCSKRNCIEFIDKKDSFNALELHPIFYSLISWILSNQLENKQLIQQAELLYKKYKPIGIDVLQFFLSGTKFEHWQSRYTSGNSKDIERMLIRIYGVNNPFLRFF